MNMYAYITEQGRNNPIAYYGEFIMFLVIRKTDRLNSSIVKTVDVTGKNPRQIERMELEIMESLHCLPEEFYDYYSMELQDNI